MPITTNDAFEQPVLIIGAGPGGSALLQIFSRESAARVLGIVDSNCDAPGVTLARSLGITVYAEVEEALKDAGHCIVFNMTHDQHLAEIAARYVGAGSVLGGQEARFFWHLISHLQVVKSNLLENQVRLQAVLNNIRDGIISITSKGIIEDLNPAVEAIFGFRPDELIGRSVNLLMPEPQKSEHDSYIANYQRTGERRVIGRYREVIAQHKCGHKLPLELSVSEMELGGSKHFVGMIRDITERKMAEEKLTQLAMYDQLTGLPNRTNFFKIFAFALAQARRNKSSIALLFIDLDGFKTVNDTLGHDMGDHLLVEVAMRLIRNTRESDASARMGGDEFTVILNNLQDIDGACIVADKLIKAINLPMQIQGHTCHVGASIGIAIYPNDAERIEELINIADRAMYRAKANGRNTCVLGTA